MPVPVTGAASPRRLIRDEVFLRLLDAIVDGDLLPGEQLYDAEIERWVGVSRTPVREALNQLAAMGLVEILPQRRTRVTPIEPERLRALITTVGVLVSGVVRDATPLLTDVDREALKRADGDDAASIVRTGLSSDGFLGVFVRRLDNATVARLLKRHLPEVQRALKASASDASLAKAVPLKGSLIDAAVAGKADKAARAAADLFEKALVTIADGFATPEKGTR
ncbi:GntR family transcriptional regulator [Leifsonia sp. fls2-241-R2A-40a]|uniref:GntR family transcriptional regulator n=1 Tax=Leifsonia sp. fls2-241-R2A-40a TaxID=3040290 RepID=UPI00254F003D|nr:GntR family transcriptional regulator [Leifsonia sp. fls2-241-R2A-40a]